MKKIFYTFNLQLFSLVSSGANATVASGTFATGQPNTDLSPEMKEFYDTRIIRLASANLVHQQFGQKRDIPKGSGKTISFRKFTPLGKALTPLSEGITPAGQTLTVTEETATPEQYGAYVKLTDMLELAAIDPIIDETVKLISNQAGLTIDTVVRNVLQSGTNVVFSPKINATTGAITPVNAKSALDNTCKLTVRTIKEVVAYLRANNAPTIDGAYYQGIIHPYTAADLMDDDDWKDVENYAEPENRMKGEIGRIAGVRFVQSSEAAITVDGGQGGTLPVFSTLIFGDGAYGTTKIEGGGLEVIVKPKGYADPLNQVSSVGWKALVTAKILIPQYMFNIFSTTDTFVNAVAN